MHAGVQSAASTPRALSELPDLRASGHRRLREQNCKACRTAYTCSPIKFTCSCPCVNNSSDGRRLDVPRYWDSFLACVSHILQCVGRPRQRIVTLEAKDAGGPVCKPPSEVVSPHHWPVLTFGGNEVLSSMRLRQAKHGQTLARNFVVYNAAYTIVPGSQGGSYRAACNLPKDVAMIVVV